MSAKRATEHYVEALSCLNAMHSDRFAALDEARQDRTIGHLSTTAIAHALSGLLALQLSPAEKKPKREPREVRSLGSKERDAEWTAADGSTRRWDDATQRWLNPESGWAFHGDETCGPYTEVVE